ncbi:MAG TPA: GMC family oxidoreductase N-terminal domain-containing protein [Aggregatilineales bacterium]|nr:GMC family oxidoreductase N-terminal domain-containing protein [Aggregatilineales bacterium]
MVAESTLRFSDREWETLTAICDTLAPSLSVEADPHGFYARKASDIGVPGAVFEAFELAASSAQQRLTKLALDLFDNELINLILGGPFKRFATMSLDEQTTMLDGWANSRYWIRRYTFQAFKRLVLFCFYTVSDENDSNPNWAAIGYPGPPPHGQSSDNPIKPLSIDADSTLTTDVIIVGSGAGGGVVAGELTAAGLDVIVLEKGGYYTEADFDGRELSAAQHLFENRGFMATADLGIVVLAGSTLGGGTTINWCASFRTPDYVLQEWEDEYGVTGYTGKAYQDALDAVSRRSHVDSDESTPNPQNAALELGAQALGLPANTIPRNVNGCGDCGFCNYGCRYGAKQSTARTYLHDAYQRGARIVVGAEAERVLIENGQAVGVAAKVTTAQGTPVALTIKARAVVVSAGSIHTPALLMRSGLTNAHIGQNLHLHPTSVSYGLYDHLIEGWHGVLMSRYVSAFNNLDNCHYGVTLETAPIHPGIGALVLPWANGLQHKRVMERIATLGNIIILTRDRGGGRITLDSRGKPMLHYKLSPEDAAHLQHGLIESLRIHHAAGATEIGAPHTKPMVYRRDQDSDLEAFLTGVQNAGLWVNDIALLSAHQMSSCRMGANPARGALDPTGETFEVRNLFVADGSVLPTATGVNPMLSIMGVSYMIAQYVKARLK